MKKPLVLLLTVFLKLWFPQASIAQEIVLENQTLRAAFSNETGALLQLENKQTGWKAQNRKELALSFNMLVPLTERRNNQVLGTDQKVQSVVVSTDKKKIVFQWNKLKSKYGGVLDILLTGTVELSEMGLSFHMEVVNKSPYIIEAISYPALGDIPQPSPDQSLEHFREGYDGMDKSGLLPYFQNSKGYWGVDWPTQATDNPRTSFSIVASPVQGLYIGLHDTSLKEMVQWVYELKPGYGISHNWFGGEAATAEEAGKFPSCLQLNVWHFPFVNAGETASLSTIQVNTFTGSWHKGVDNYKTWRNTWFQLPSTPTWAKEVHSWYQLHINSAEEEWRAQYKDLVSYAEECAKNGVKAIQLVGWNNGGQDRGNPSHDHDPHLGTWQELKDAIAACEKLGVHIILFNKYTWADQSTEWFRNELINYAVKNPYGDYHVYGGYQYQTPTQLADINTRRLIPMCQNSSKWREIANKEFVKSIDLGASGMLYDENQHHGGGNYCFDKSHGHHVPAFNYQGDIPLVKGFMEITARQKPDYLLAGEANYDIENMYYHLQYFRIDAFSHIALKRYMDPFTLIAVACSGFNDRAMINSCLRYRYNISYEPFNFKGRLTDFPLTLGYGKKIDHLRSRYKEFLWEGVFSDTLGATVTQDGKKFSTYSVFKNAQTNKSAVVIVNNDRNKEIEVEVKIDHSQKPLVFTSPENPESQAYHKSVKVAPMSVIVVMESEK